MPSPPPIALLTDFGQNDWFVGVMKAVIAGIAPEAPIIDITHGITPGDISSAAFVLAAAREYFPAETVFCCVVDPGVGTDRRILCVEDGRYVYVAPDNGLLSMVMGDNPIRATQGQSGSDRLRVHSAEERKFWLPAPGRTFHGRDIFAPIAAHLSNGHRPSEFGPAITDPKITPAVMNSISADQSTITGTIVYIDGFGNLITSIQFDRVVADHTRTRPDNWRIELKDHSIAFALSYGSAPRGELIFYSGSTGLIEIAVNMGNAARLTDSHVGDAVRLLLE